MSGTSNDTPIVLDDAPSPGENAALLMTDILSSDTTPCAIVLDGEEPSPEWPPPLWRYVYQRLPGEDEAVDACLGLKGLVENVDFSCRIQTLITLVGRDNSGPAQGGERAFAGCRTLQLHRDDNFTLSVLRPCGLPPFEVTRWHPYDLTRIGFLGMKKLSRTHFSINWLNHEWTITSLSSNGITVNDNKLPENAQRTLRAGDAISASGGLLRLTVSMVKLNAPEKEQQPATVTNNRVVISLH